MGRITSSVGIASGVQITSTVDQLIAISGRPRDQLKTQSTTLSNQKNALQTLTALTIGVQLAGTRLGNANLFTQRAATSSDSTIIDARVKSDATPAIGQYQFRAVQLAQGQQLQSSRFSSRTDAVGSGSFSVRYGGFVDKGISLDDINNGDGIKRGKIKITDRAGQTGEIDLTYARTIDDVITAINGSSGVAVKASTSGGSIILSDVSGTTTNNLRVQEVGNGGTAASLGLGNINAAANTATGDDIVKVFREQALGNLNDGRGVRFDDALPDLKVNFRDGTNATLDLHKIKVTGTKATATTPGTDGSNAKVTFNAVKAGSGYDNVVIRFVDNPNISKGNETVAYDASDPSLKTLTFQIDGDRTTARDIVNALNNDDAAKKYFTASLPTGSAGSGTIDVNDTVVSSGGAVIEPYAGTNESSVGQVLDALNALAPTKLQARIAADGKRIELTDISTDTGGTFSVADLYGSHVASDLGLTTTASGGTISGKQLTSGLKTSQLANLGGGAGLGTLGVLNLTDRSGATAAVNLATARTLDDVISGINGSGLGIKASYNSARNGLQLVDSTGATASNLIAANGDGTNTGDKLGLTVNAAVTSKSGANLKLQTVSEATKLDSLFGNAGIVRGKFTLTDTNGAKATINVDDDVKTVGDLLSAIKATNLAISARINDAGDGIALIDTAHGTQSLSVAEVSGNTTAASLRLTNTATTQTIGGLPTKVIDASTTLQINISATDSLDDIVTKVNDLNVGIRASVFSDGSSVKPYRLALFNQQTGTQSNLQLDTSNANFSFSESAAGRDAVLAVGDVAGGSGFLATSSSNTFDNAVPDVTLTVKNTSTDPTTVSIGSSSDNLVTAVKTFVDSYNKLYNKIDELTLYDSDNNKSALLQGDATTLRLRTDVSNLVSGRFLSAGTIQSIKALGVAIKSDGTLSLNQTTLTDKITDDPTAVKNFFSKATTGFAAKVKTLGDTLAGVGNSLLLSRSNAIDAKLQTLADRISFYNARLDREKERLLTKYYNADIAIGKVKNNSSFLNTLSQAAGNNLSSSSG